MAKGNADSGKQFMNPERFREIVIRTGIQRIHFVTLLTTCGQYNNRRLRPLANAPGDFDAVVSNSLVHHLPDASVGFAAIARVAGDAGIFLRDLARPRTAADDDALVDRYAAGAPDDARALFHASLRAAFTVDEIRALADAAGLVDARVAMTSDRHWTLVRGPRRS